MLRLVLFLLSACAVATAPEPALSVHDRLATPVHFAVSGAGAIDAEHRLAADTWVGGEASIAIADGVWSAHLEGDLLVVDALDVSFEPVGLPATVFGQPASLAGVRLTLARSSAAEPTWTSAATADATFELDLDLAWGISIAGSTTPLGIQRLPTISMNVNLSGTDSELDASLGLRGAGELWRWADLVALSELKLALAATSRFE